MPSFRDLKGRPVDDVIATPRGGRPPVPVEQEARGVLPQAAKDALRRISERPRQRSGAHPPDSDKFHTTSPPETEKPQFDSPGVPPLPEDFEAGLRALEGSLGIIVEQSRLLVEAVEFTNGQMAALRQRAERDAARLAKLNAVLKTLTE